MRYLLQNLTLLDIDSSLNEQKISILLNDGIVEAINKNEDAHERLDLDGKIVTPGWFGLNAHFNDPGFEHKEDLQSGLYVASSGGFTDIEVIPETNPVIQSKSQINYLKSQVKDLVDIHICAALSKDLEDEQLNELIDLSRSGVVSFSNGDRAISNSQLLLNGLIYLRHSQGLLVQNPFDKHLSQNTQMHEGITSTKLGMTGDPALSEELLVSRDIKILRYSGGRLHFSKISSATSVALIREAKKEGLHLTCDTPLHHLLFTDTNVSEFNTIYKSRPPFRSDEDRIALIEGLKDGTIDAISTHHRPQDQESKQLEFDLSEPGQITLQTFYPSILKLSNEIDLGVLIKKITHGPRKVLGLETSTISEGKVAKLTILDPKAKWVMNSETNYSKSKNSPFWNQELIGKVYGTVNGSKLSFLP